MRDIYALDTRLDLTPTARTALLGGKAAGLGVMAAELGLPVPPGFTITTQVCKRFLSGGWPAGLDEELRTAMRRLEETLAASSARASVIGMGTRRFGDRHNPLLVSVRSGAPVSMPGMMDTILDLGLNDETARGLASVSGDDAFAADCHRRFREMFTRIVGVAVVPADPWEQLRAAVQAVFRSWNSERALAYRRREHIPDDLGTAVTVQAMVFGNLGRDSASGVLFTRNPSTGDPTLYGDVLFAAQGEDVVTGTHQTEPLTVLDQRLPDAGRELRQAAATLERHFADLCDIEFTVERGTLWMLQVRAGKRTPQAALRIAADMADAGDFPLSKADAVKRVATILANPPTISRRRDASARALATGLAASPGIATGEIATTAAAALAAADAGRRVIMVRPETSPEDVQGMARAAGVLTARGGLASHAAVVARGWGIPAVVGAAAVEVDGSAVTIGGRRLRAGDTITIDGSSGEIFAGVVAQEVTVVPEAAILLGWARELGIPIPSQSNQLPSLRAGEGQAGESREPAGDDLLRALALKGSASLDGLASALLATPQQVKPIVDRLHAEGLAETAAGAIRLSGRGTAQAAELLAADRRRWGASAAQALDAFVALDPRMKEAVTAWQLKEVDGRQVLNDHTDAAYDAGVLDRLARLHRDASAWLSSLSDAPPAIATYGVRLEHALEAVRRGDQRFIASPRVDSYHSVWFELHEALIQLAGRSRAEEAAAGRA